MIHFHKILKYELNPKDVNVFTYLSDVISQKNDPPSLEQNKLELIGSIVFHSPLRRAVECIRKIKGVKYIPLKELAEIPFDLNALCSQEEWGKERSVIVRRKFKKAFIEDKLLISRHEIWNQIEFVLSKCLLKNEASDISVVSHSFKLKLIEACIDSNKKIIKTPELINNYIFDDIKTFGFGEGFNLNILRGGTLEIINPDK